MILIPTGLEQQLIEPEIRSAASEFGWSIQRCGFGPIASASISASLIGQRKPKRVLLLGIAGALVDFLPLGSATAFDRVCCYGVGVGMSEQYQSAADLGFHHGNQDGVSIGDWLDLQATPLESTHNRVLLTTPAASADETEAMQKRKAVPAAIAEDMEGFSVAVSCHLANVPLTIIRGISNQAGDRDREHWRIEGALLAAAKLAIDEVIMGPLP